VRLFDKALYEGLSGVELVISDSVDLGLNFNRFAKSKADDGGCALRAYSLITTPDQQLTSFLNVLTGYVHYKNYDLKELRKIGSPEGRAVKMDADGLNVFTVLRNWMTHRDHRHRYEFVLSRMRQAFGPVFDDMSFETTGQLVQCTFFARDVKQGYQPRHAADGVLVGLLHLTAIASLSLHTLSAIDDLEGALHPDATRHILQAAQDWCDEQGATLLIASQLPHVLDFFNKREDQVFIMRPCTSDQPLKEGDKPESQLVRLDEEFDRDWLRHFSLGALYGKEFGVQAAPLEDAGE
jgi:predicted ATPase